MATCCLQRVMQRNTLDDKIVPDKQQWDIAVKFMEETLREKLQQSKKYLTPFFYLGVGLMEETLREKLQQSMKWEKKLYGGVRAKLMAASVQFCTYVRLRSTSNPHTQTSVFFKLLNRHPILKSMAISHFLKSIFNDVTDVCLNPNQ